MSHLTAPTAISSSIDHRSPRRSFRPWWRWLLTALAFPPAGFIAHVVAGRVDSVSAAVLNGVIAGAGIGAAQWALLRHRDVSLAWIAATAVGLGAGLAAGAALVSYRTDITSLALMGAVSGLGVGIAQGATFGNAKRAARLERGHRRAVRPRMDRHHRRRHRRQPAMGRLRRLRVHHPRLPAEHLHRSILAKRSRHEPSSVPHPPATTRIHGLAEATTQKVTS